MKLPALLFSLGSVALAGCGDNGGAAVDVDASTSDVDAYTGVSCFDLGHLDGERYIADDNCNFCTCNADGSSSCSQRTCIENNSGCTYDGVDHAYGERFPSVDACDECVCAPSGLACTQRPGCAGVVESAILLESLTEPCGDADPTFTGQSVLDDLPRTEVSAAFNYDRDRDPRLYPEVLDDTTSTFRLNYNDGFVVCRIPAKGQEAIDIEISSEFITADGSFDEGFHSYLRKDRTGFVDAWYVNATLPFGALTGTYDYLCTLDPGSSAFTAQIDRDGSAFGAVHKVCETDLYLTVGSWAVD